MESLMKRYIYHEAFFNAQKLISEIKKNLKDESLEEFERVSRY